MCLFKEFERTHDGPGDPDLNRGRGGIGRLETTGPEDRKLADLEARASAGEIFDAAVSSLCGFAAMQLRCSKRFRAAAICVVP